MGSAMGGNGDLQAPHLPVSAMCLAGIRFGFPQEGQFRTMGISVSPLTDAAEDIFVAIESI
jgi:hypothetical protein